jgi:putative DNA primase/helicase
MSGDAKPTSAKPANVKPFRKPEPPTGPPDAPREAAIVLDPKDPRDSAQVWLQREQLIDRFWFADGEFYRWASPHYRLIPLAALRSEIGAFLGRAHRYGRDATLLRFQPTSRHVDEVVDALRQIGYTAAPSPSWLDDTALSPDECALCSDSILHIPTRTRYAPRPEFFNINALTFPCDLDAPDPVHWLRFLDSIWPDDPEPIALLQEWFGYCLTPDTHQQKIMALKGPRRCGKGTIARVLVRLLGESNTCAPTLGQLSTHFGRAVLIGKTAAVFGDAKLSARADAAAITEALLSISGEDMQTIPRKNKGDWSGRLRTRFTLLMNELPRLDDAGGALVSRLLILPMTESFLGREDLALDARLAAELPGIFRWALDGWTRLHARGHFPALASSDDMRADLEDITSPVKAFLDECCHFDEHASVPRRDLFQAWKRWCEAVGRDHTGNEDTFGRNLNAAYPAIRSTRPRTGDAKRPRLYEGIGLKVGW